jgi:Nif-specific regulatory protein
MSDESAELANLRRERDLYLRLLDLGSEEDLEALIREALALIVSTTEATRGSLELNDESGEPRWSTAHGLSGSELEQVRQTISRGIIAEALASGKIIETPSALVDSRFSGRESVQRGRIGAVLCAPIGDTRPRGVLYLNSEQQGAFKEHRARVESFARHLGPLVDRILANRRARAHDDATASLRERMRLDGIIGHSPALAGVLEQAAAVAPLNVHVLLTGETGTGKSQLARVIHDNSPRARASLVELNCATIPAALMESELFGAAAGAHSAASRRMQGKVEAADGGTLFLDEIGEIPLDAQAKLLQLLQSKQYYMLGATAPTHADVRIIAATNLDLEQAVAERRFREDLFWRLNVVQVRMPALTERSGDIPHLAAHFLGEACRKHGFVHLELSPNATRALQCADWPGNIRQLANTVEMAAIRGAAMAAKRIEREHLFPGKDDATGGPPTFQEATRQFQAKLLRDALESNGWNVAETARRLDVARSHLYELIRALGIARAKS